MYVDYGALIARLRAAPPIEIDEECLAEDTPKYGSFVSFCICLARLRLDLVPWYTSGFQ